MNKFRIFPNLKFDVMGPTDNDGGEADKEVDDDAWLEDYDLVFSAQKEEFRRRIEMREGDYLLRSPSCLILND